MKVVECPRDAMQGIHDFIPTQDKIEYLNSLLKVGFDVLDCGSFVSPKAIPQLKDTKEVLDNIIESETKLLTIVANKRGAQDACSVNKVDIIGYPFSVSETFQKRNTNASIDESLVRVEEIQSLAKKNNKTLLVYLSMAFGNPYGDDWHEDIVCKWGETLNSKIGITNFSLADTIGCSNTKSISSLFKLFKSESSNLEVGAHLHSTLSDAKTKAKASFEAGCDSIDGALLGYGGCPMAKDELVGNMPTEEIMNVIIEHNIKSSIDIDKFNEAKTHALQFFNHWA